MAITDQRLQNLASMRGDGNILPFPSLTVQKRNLKGQDVAVVLVHPADAPPVRFKGTVWVRVGPRRAIASPQEERILAERRRHRDAPFDIHPMREADLGDLDVNLFREAYLPAAVSPAVLVENRRSPEEQMASLRLLELGPPAVPTVLGLLAIGSRHSPLRGNHGLNHRQNQCPKDGTRRRGDRFPALGNRRQHSSRRRVECRCSWFAGMRRREDSRKGRNRAHKHGSELPRSLGASPFVRWGLRPSRKR
jgi:hypothetical protein